ncbi:MAG: type II toxin-antitoxin system RelE/ParE family toxin [Pirellulaceae bacterium]
MWHIATTTQFDEWFADLDDDGQAELIAKVNLLKLLGPKLSRPHADTLNGSKHANMKELRASTADRVLRVAFAFDPDRTGILLVAGDKSGVSQKRFYKRLIAKADDLFDTHLAKLKAKKKKESERG